MSRSAWAAVVCLLVLPNPLSADIIVLKRDAGLAFTDGAVTDTLTDARFASATVVTVATADTMLFMANPNSMGDWQNWGAATRLDGGNQLYRFDLSAVGSLTGATITKAELRLHHASGNSGGSVGRIITQDWLEGTQSGGFPGAAGGASCAHPRGYNTAAWQNASGGTTPPLTTWGPSSDSRFSLAADGDMPRNAKGTSPPGQGWQVFDVTDIVAAWTRATDPAPNYGFSLDPGNYPRHPAEAGWNIEPALFVDYVPEPACLALVGAGWVLLSARRGRTR